MSSVAQMLRQAEALKASVSDSSKATTETWVTRQKLEDLYKKVLLIDLEYALDKKIEQELWNHAFKNQINNLQSQAKDKQSPKRAEVQASLNLFLETASGFYLQFLQLLCTTFKLDLPFRRKSAFFGIMKEKAPTRLKIVPPKKSSCLYVCQHCLVHLGDIARYRQQIEQAQTYYWHAANLVPFNGQPYNQLAILEAAKGNKLSTVFYYIRSLAVKVPFPVAATNLEKLYAKLAKDTPEFIGKLCVSEMIRGFLQFHALVHLSTDLQKAVELSEKLAAGLPAHVTSGSFPSHVLVQIVAINVFAMHHAQRHLGNGGNTNGSALDHEELGSDEEKCFDLVFNLTVSMLDILLQYTPKQEHRLKAYFTLPAVKLLLDWLKLNPKNITHPALASSSLWFNLSKILNNIQNVSPKESTDLSQFDDIPLPEDGDLRCFQPIEKAHSCYSFSRVPNEGLQPETEMAMRCQRLIALGQWVAEEFPSLNLLNVTTTKKGKLQFSAPNTPPGNDVNTQQSPERKSTRQNVAIQAIIQKQAAQAGQDKAKTVTDKNQGRQAMTSPKYLLGVPTSEPLFMKGGNPVPTKQSPPTPQMANPTKSPTVQLLTNHDIYSQRQLPPGTASKGEKKLWTPNSQPSQQPSRQQQQKDSSASQQKLSWQQSPQQQPKSQSSLQPPPAQLPWQQQMMPPWQREQQHQQQTFSRNDPTIRSKKTQGSPTGPQQQITMPNSQPIPNRLSASNNQGQMPMMSAGQGLGMPQGHGQIRSQGPNSVQYGQVQGQMPQGQGQAQPNSNQQLQSQMAMNSSFPSQQPRPPFAMRQAQSNSGERYPVPNVTGSEGAQTSLPGGQPGMRPPMMPPPLPNQIPPDFSVPPPGMGPTNNQGTPNMQSNSDQPTIPPGGPSFPGNRFSTNQMMGNPNRFPNAPGMERMPNASNKPQQPQQQQRQTNPSNQQMPQMTFPFQQGQYMNPLQGLLGLASLGMSQQKGVSPMEGLFGKPNTRFPQQEEFSPNMMDIIGTLTKMAVQPPRGGNESLLPQSRAPGAPATFQGHAEGTPKPDNFGQPTKNSNVPSLNIDLDTGKPPENIPSTSVGPQQQQTNAQGTYSLFSGSPWLGSTDSKSLGSSPFSSQSSSIRNSPDPSSDAYSGDVKGSNAGIDLGLRFSNTSEDHWGNKIPPGAGDPGQGSAPFFQNSVQSIWSSQGPSPLERLLELQKQQRQMEPH